MLAFRCTSALKLQRLTLRTTPTVTVRSNLAVRPLMRTYAKKSEAGSLSSISKEEKKVKSLVKPSASSVLNTTKDNLLQAMDSNVESLQQALETSEDAIRTKAYLRSMELISEDDEYVTYKKSIEGTNVTIRFNKTMLPDEAEPREEEDGEEGEEQQPEPTTSSIIDIAIDYGKKDAKQWILSCKCGENESLDVLTMCLSTEGWKSIPNMDEEELESLPDNAILFVGLEEQTQEQIMEYLNRLGINNETSAASRWISFQKEAQKDQVFLKELTEMLNASQ